MILALDLGTKTGWAIRDGQHLVGSGTWNLTPRKSHSRGARFCAFRHALDESLALTRKVPSLVAYESVAAHKGTAACQIYGGFLSALLIWCEEASIQYIGVHVGTLKKFATGRGNADKEAMMAAARRRWPELPLIDDNHADALWIAEWAAKQGGSVEPKAKARRRGQARRAA